MARRKTQSFIAYSLNGGWQANFSFESITHKEARPRGRGRGGRNIQKQTWVALDVLRRRRHSKGSKATKNRNWFRTIAGLVKLTSIEVKLPHDNHSLILQLDNDIPPTAGIFDFITDTEDDRLDREDWPFIPTAIKVLICCTRSGKWPDFVKSAEIRNPRTRREKQITIKTLLNTYFGIQDVTEGDGLMLNPDGLTLIGKKKIPWEQQRYLPGKFRYRISSDVHLLEIEKNPDWIKSLREYQYQVINATRQRMDEQGLPEVDSPGVGLVSSQIPDKVFWKLTDKQWIFKPDPGMFEGEIRGAAGATSRLRFDEVSVSENGNIIRCTAGINDGNSDKLSYQYKATRESLWTGSFNAELEEDGRELLTSLLTQYGIDEKEDKVWIQTESGPLQIPLQKQSNGHEEAESVSKEGLFKGLLRLSEIPWTKSSDELPPAPDISQVGYSSLIVKNADGFVAEFSFNTGDQMDCETIEVEIGDPVLRLEDYLPVYLPPPSEHQLFNGPPDLPKPVELGDYNPWAHFLGLSLTRRKDYIPDPQDTYFKVNISFQPGIADKELLLEGDWTNSHTQILIPPARIKDIKYWYRPPGLHWIPSLPLYGDPSKGERLNDKRTYMPLKGKEPGSLYLKHGINWQIPSLKTGLFETEEGLKEPSQYAVYSWVIPELPGIALELVENAPLTITDGMPEAGKLGWVWRHDLPILDEINALRASNEEKEDLENRTISYEGWIDQLKEIYTLSQVKGSMLMRSGVNIKKGSVLSEKDKKVKIDNLFANQQFSGLASIGIFPPTASLDIREGDNTISAITNEKLLKGIDAAFTVSFDEEKQQFQLQPSSGGEVVKMEAGTLMPYRYKLAEEYVTMDQQGMAAFQIKNDNIGRAVMVTEPETGSLKKTWLWSHKELDLSTAINQASFNFSNIPLVIENGQWVYRDDIAFLKAEQLRNFRWSGIGSVSFWGLPFQVCQLKELLFEQGAESTPLVPTKLVFEGILHLKETIVQLADSASQKVRVAFTRSGNTWELSEFTGNILWPFYQLSPDLSVTGTVPDPMPWLSSTVNFDRQGDVPKLVFGEEGFTSVSFNFMERIWKLPVRYTGVSIDHLLNESHSFDFELIPEEEPAVSALTPVSGSFHLKRKGVTKSSRLLFNIILSHESAAERSLIDVDFDYSFNNGTEQLTLSKANILSFDSSRHLIALSGKEKGAIELSPGKLTLAINKKVGWNKDKTTFELLPGWYISDKESLQAYLSLQVVPPPAVGVVVNAGVSNLQMVIETAISTPDVLSCNITYTLAEGNQPQLDLQLTGILKLSNEISWTVGDHAYTHEIDVFLRQASLNGLKLESQGRAFFRPKYIPASDQNEHITGMIEIPCLTNHRLTLKKGKAEEPILHWTAAQNIRIANTRSYSEEILLRGVKVQLPEITHDRSSRNNDYLLEETAINFEPSEKVEMGFVGSLGAELYALLKTSQDLMIIDATEAFWIRPFANSIDERSPFELWRKQSIAISGLPTFDFDFDDSGKSNEIGWIRLAMPFITDSSNFINSDKKSPLKKLLCNEPPTESNTGRDVKSEFIKRERLLRLSEIDQYSLDNQPGELDLKRGMEPVIFDPVAYERLFPYTSKQKNFEPGWQTFYDWYLSEENDLSHGIPFGSTLDSILALTKNGKVVQMAVTEAVPRVDKRPGDDNFQIAAYYITSPAARLDEIKVPFRPSTHSLRQLAGTPRIFLEWKGIAEEELNYIPPNVANEVLEWANSFTVNELRYRIPDAPGGFSATEEGYGIGEVVAKRMQNRIQKQGPFISLKQLLDVRGFGMDKLSDFIYAVAKNQYDFSFEQQQFEEVRINIQFWLPANSSKLEGPLLASQSVFLLGITSDDTWDTVLFEPDETEEDSKVRKRIWEWVDIEKNRLNIDVSPLMRARLLAPSNILEERKYYLIESRSSGGAILKSRREELGTKHPFSIDPRYEHLPTTPYTDALSAGPELLEGKVYYYPRTWHEPTKPVLDNQSWKGIISNVKLEPALIDRGDTTTITWECDAEGSLELVDRERTQQWTISAPGVLLKPERTTVYTIILRNNDGEILDQYETAVLVRQPAAGNGVGFAHKIAGTAPGPLNASRQPVGATEENYQHWLEMTRDVVFEDITRSGQSVLEPGVLLPASRKINFESTEFNLADNNPFLVPRVGHIFSSGRPGAMMRFRLASLIAGKDQVVRRGGSWANEFRFPRPVPLPKELYPFDPEYVMGPEEIIKPTCSVEKLHGPQPFSFYGLAWQDPIYNRRLHATAQEQLQGDLFLGLDRIVYGGKDLCYPEVKLLNMNLTNWKVILEVRIRRTVNFQLETVESRSFEITKGKVINLFVPEKDIKETVIEGENRFVFEVGINQPEAIDDSFEQPPENEDLLVVSAALLINNDEREHIQLTGIIRTDKDCWSQPQNAFGVVRKVEQEGEESKSDIVAFGWIPKPKIVKRRNRFKADSWEGTFRYQDAFVKPQDTTVGYEILSITSYGEMMVKNI